MQDEDKTGPQSTHPIALVADDDEFFRVAIRMILTTQLGFGELLETASFDEALDRLSERRDVALALFDLQMLGRDGASSLRMVRETFLDTRVVVVSSSSFRADIVAILDAGAYGYVIKNHGVGAFREALAIVLRGGIYVPAALADLTATTVAERPAGLVSARNRPATVSLTPRQWQVLELLVQGRSNKEMARALNLGRGTVKIHLAGLYRALGVTSRAAAAAVSARLLSDGS